MRFAYLAAGFFFLALAGLGAVLPLLPTTIFVILAAGCFARSSPRLERRILEHPTFGPVLLRWRERGAIAPAAKMMAVAGMAVGYALFHVSARPSLPVAAVAFTIILACGVYVVTRPDS